MATNKSKIEWCDSTWNPIRGCSRVSEGCRHCYAERLAARNLPAHASPTTGKPFAVVTSTGPQWTGDVELIESALHWPTTWKRSRRIFVNSMSDVFHARLRDRVIDEIFEIMMGARQHTYLVLTKRPARMREYIWRRWPNPDRRTHIHLGVSIEDQDSANERLPHLLQTPADVRFLSCEPLLGPVDLLELLWGQPVVHQIIVGGESGPGARPMAPRWARQLRNQAKAIGAAFFFKQWGEWAPLPAIDSRVASSPTCECDGVRMVRIGKRAAGNMLDGAVWQEMQL